MLYNYSSWTLVDLIVHVQILYALNIFETNLAPYIKHKFIKVSNTFSFHNYGFYLQNQILTGQTTLWEILHHFNIDRFHPTPTLTNEKYVFLLYYSTTPTFYDVTLTVSAVFFFFLKWMSQLYFFDRCFIHAFWNMRFLFVFLRHLYKDPTCLWWFFSSVFDICPFSRFAVDDICRCIWCRPALEN